MEPIINSQLPEFKVQAFQNGSFKTVTNEDVKANGLFSSSIRQTLRLYVLPNWWILQKNTTSSKPWA